MQQPMINPGKLTVGFFSPGWPLSHYPNGVVSYVENVISGFDPDLVDTVVFANSVSPVYKHNSVVDTANFSVAHIGDRLMDSILCRASIPDALRQRIGRRIVRAVNAAASPIDILEMEESFGACKLIANSLSMPIVTRLHGPWFLTGNALGMPKDREFERRARLEGNALVECEAITSPCRSLLDQVREYYRIDLPDAKVIPNPAPLIANPNSLWQQENCREKVILFVGRFDLHKGGDLVIDTFRFIASQDKEVQLHFVGPDRGVLIDGNSVSLPVYIEQTISDPSIRARITFFGHQNAEEIRLHRRSALVTLIASRYENFPMTLLEALSLGCPVVTTAVGGIKEIVKDGFNGLLVDRINAEDLADKLFSLTNNPELRQSLSRNAIDDCMKNYHPRVVSAKTLDFYKTVIANHS